MQGTVIAIPAKLVEPGISPTPARLELLGVRKEILEAFMSLVAEGIYPSVERIAARIKASGNLLEIRLVLREVKLEAAHGSNNNPSRRKAL